MKKWTKKTWATALSAGAFCVLVGVLVTFGVMTHTEDQQHWDRELLRGKYR